MVCEQSVGMISEARAHPVVFGETCGTWLCTTYSGLFQHLQSGTESLVTKTKKQKQNKGNIKQRKMIKGIIIKENGWDK